MTDTTRRFSFSYPTRYQGQTYPTAEADIDYGNGTTQQGRIFADADGIYHTLDAEGNILDATPVHGLDEVVVTAPRRDNLLSERFNRFLTESNDNTRIVIPPYQQNKIPDSSESALAPNVKDNAITRILSALSPDPIPHNSYRNSLSPYTYRDDVDPHGKIAQSYWTTGNEKASRLGNLGLVKIGENKYRLYDEEGNMIRQCAKTRNELEKMLGHPTTNNAWDTFGVYGDSTLFNGYSKKTGPYNFPSYVVQNQIAAYRTQNALENLDLQTGDVVDLFSPLTHYAKTAYKQGTLNRSNSHTGVIFQPSPGLKNKTYIIHNVNGNISVDPLGTFLVNGDNLFPKWRVTGFHRPGTKEHPYLKDGKPAHL